MLTQTDFLSHHFTFSIIAEGVPESQTRAFNKVAVDKGVGIIGPATVGGIKVNARKKVTGERVVFK